MSPPRLSAARTPIRKRRRRRPRAYARADADREAPLSPIQTRPSLRGADANDAPPTRPRPGDSGGLRPPLAGAVARTFKAGETFPVIPAAVGRLISVRVPPPRGRSVHVARSSALPPLALAAAVGLFALAAALTAQTPAPPAAAAPESIKRQEEANAKLFADLEQAMLRLAQRLEKSDRPDDQARAKTIRRALELAEKEGVEGQFKKMIVNLGQPANPNATDVNRWIGDDEQLARACATSSPSS